MKLTTVPQVDALANLNRDELVALRNDLHEKQAALLDDIAAAINLGYRDMPETMRIKRNKMVDQIDQIDALLKA